MRFSNITLATILVSTAFAAPLADAKANAVAVAEPEAGLVSWAEGLVTGAVSEVEGLFVSLTSGTSQSFNTNSFGTNLIALAQRMKSMKLDEKCSSGCDGDGDGYGNGLGYSDIEYGNLLQDCVACVQVIISCCLNIADVIYSGFDAVAEGALGAGSSFQQNNVHNLDWNALSESYAKLAKVAPPTISKSSVSDIGTQLVSWGNSAKSNTKLSASNLQTLMKSTTQLQMLTHGSVPTWSIGKKYSSADFGKMLINYGNACHSGKVSATNVAAINGVLQQIDSAKIF